MSPILAARCHQEKFRSAVIQEGSLKAVSPLPTRIMGDCAIVLDESTEPIINGNFGKSLDNRTSAVNPPKIDHNHQSSVQVRYQNEVNVHYWIWTPKYLLLQIWKMFNVLSTVLWNTNWNECWSLEEWNFAPLPPLNVMDIVGTRHLLRRTS